MKNSGRLVGVDVHASEGRSRVCNKLEGLKSDTEKEKEKKGHIPK
jgi:hypothetical protein